MFPLPPLLSKGIAAVCANVDVVPNPFRIQPYYGHESAEGEEEGRAVTGEHGEPSGDEEKTATTRRHIRKSKLS